VVTVSNLNDSSSTVDAGCIGAGGSATVYPYGGTSPYTYTWSNGQTGQTDSLLTAGNYTCDIVDANGCAMTTTVVVASGSSLAPDAGVSTTITQGQTTQLTGTGGPNYVWDPAASLSCSNCQNPLASPTVTTTYTLTVFDSLGCAATDTVTIFVDILCGDVFVPNAFSPNNDGQNDVLFVRGNCIATMDFKVFNRWGEMVFHSTDPAIGWDGVWRGVLCENAVFTYVLTGTEVDGSEINLKGNVSLIR
jgi:gliding motility-associated-like protein